MGKGRSKTSKKTPARSRKPSVRKRRPGGTAESAEPSVADVEAVEAEPVEVEEAEAAGPDASSVEIELPVTEPGAVAVGTSSDLVPQDALSAYMAEVRRYSVLTREEEHELAVRYHEHGDQEAAYRLVTANLRLVVMVAREYMRAFQNLLDLIQEGNLGLLEAVRQFDPYRGVRLPSYAVWWIRAYIIRYVMNNFRLVKVGTTQAQRRLFFNLRKEKARLEAKGFTPTAKRIASSLGVKEKEVIEMEQRMGASEMSADATVYADSETRLIDLLPAPGATAEEQVADSEFITLMRRKLEEFADTLEGRELEIYNERLVAEEPLTLQELGERYGVSRERVRQIEEGVKKRLREFLVEQVRELGDDESIVT